MASDYSLSGAKTILELNGLDFKGEAKETPMMLYLHRTPAEGFSLFTPSRNKWYYERSNTFSDYLYETCVIL